MKKPFSSKAIGAIFNLGLFLAALVIVAGCTKRKEPTHEVLELDKRLKTAEELMVEFDAKIKKTPPSNQGLVQQLNHDKELAKARLERLKMALDKLDPEFAKNRVAGGAAAPAAGGGGHH